MIPTVFQRLACYARDEENKLRHDYGYYSPLIELEVVPDGLCVKSVAGDDSKVFQQCMTVAWFDMTEQSCMTAIDDVSDGMRAAMSKER